MPWSMNNWPIHVRELTFYIVEEQRVRTKKFVLNCGRDWTVSNVVLLSAVNKAHATGSYVLKFLLTSLLNLSDAHLIWLLVFLSYCYYIVEKGEFRDLFLPHIIRN